MTTPSTSSTTVPIVKELSRRSGFLSQIAEKQVCDVNAFQKPSDIQNGTVVLEDVFTLAGMTH